jgi:hypothetical protein
MIVTTKDVAVARQIGKFRMDHIFADASAQVRCRIGNRNEDGVVVNYVRKLKSV